MNINLNDMSNQSFQLMFNIVAILCGIWFLLTGWIWVYGAAAFISYPIAIIGLFYWGLGKRTDSSLSDPILTIYIISLIISLVTLITYK